MTGAGCAYASGDAATRAECLCQASAATLYYRPMTDAIADVRAESGAARDAHTARELDPLAAARQDRDVALADARDAEERAVERAAKVRAHAEENAETCYRVACKRAALAVDAQRADVSRYASMSDGELVEALRMETFRLSRTRGTMRADVRTESGVKVAAMRAELERRGVEVPRWKFQDRPVTS